MPYKDPDKKRAHERAYYARNPDRKVLVRKYVRKYDQSDKGRAKNAERRASASKTVQAAAHKKWRDSAKGRLTLRKEWSHRRHAPGSHTVRDVTDCLAVQGHRCFYCLASLFNGYEVDHMTPISRGGSHNPDNIVCACRSCNRRKLTKTAAEFILGKPAGSLPCSAV